MKFAVAFLALVAGASAFAPQPVARSSVAIFSEPPKKWVSSAATTMFILVFERFWWLTYILTLFSCSYQQLYQGGRWYVWYAWSWGFRRRGSPQVHLGSSFVRGIHEAARRWWELSCLSGTTDIFCLVENLTATSFRFYEKHKTIIKDYWRRTVMIWDKLHLS